MSNSAKIICNGARVRELRLQRTMTQEKLATMSNVDLRTIQRAEQGRPVQLETLASVADALRVTVSEVTLTGEVIPDHPTTAEPEEQNAVVLRRITSGKTLLDILCDSFSGRLECEAEPTQQNIDALTALVEHVENRMPNPWRTPMESDQPTLAQRLREGLELTAKIDALEKPGIAAFAGTYTARAQVPHYDMDEGCMYVGRNQKFEPVKVCRISIARIGVDRVTVKVSDEWQEPAPQRVQALEVSVDDDIPF